MENKIKNVGKKKLKKVIEIDGIKKVEILMRLIMRLNKKRCEIVDIRKKWGEIGEDEKDEYIEINLNWMDERDKDMDIIVKKDIMKKSVKDKGKLRRWIEEMIKEREREIRVKVKIKIMKIEGIKRLEKIEKIGIKEDLWREGMVLKGFIEKGEDEWKWIVEIGGCIEIDSIILKIEKNGGGLRMRDKNGNRWRKWKKKFIEINVMENIYKKRRKLKLRRKKWKEKVKRNIKKIMKWKIWEMVENFKIERRKEYRSYEKRMEDWKWKKNKYRKKRNNYGSNES